MSHSPKHKKIVFYQSLVDIPNEIWEQLSVLASLYFDHRFLRSLEKNHSNIQFLYQVCTNERGKLLGFAHWQLFHFEIQELDSDWTFFPKSLTRIARKLRVLPKENPLKILNCGLPFVSGNHGLFVHSNTNQRVVLKTMIKAVHKYISENQELGPIDIFMMKDFSEKEISMTHELINLGYYAMNVEPNMKMTISSHWQDFNDFLNSLKTKFRVKAKKALTLSKDLEFRDLNCDSVVEQMTDLKRLYNKVTSKANFNLIGFNLDSYQDLLEQFKENYFLRSYYHNKELVGFLSGMHNAGALDAHFVGINYDFNRSLAIYQRMLYDYIDIAIEKQVKTINFGRTASEIKSSVGATPEHLTVYIRHKKSLTNQFLQLFLHRIQPTEFNQKFPFKEIAKT